MSNCRCPGPRGTLCDWCTLILQRHEGHPPVPPIDLGALEKHFQAQVVALFKQCGPDWKVYHPRNSKQDAPGFLDWEAVRRARRPTPTCAPRPGRLLKIELKREGVNATLQQQEWMEFYWSLPWVEVYCWQPSDLPEIARILALDVVQDRSTQWMTRLGGPLLFTRP
jgi:hypothetical protein